MFQFHLQVLLSNDGTYTPSRRFARGTYSANVYAFCSCSFVNYIKLSFEMDPRRHRPQIKEDEHHHFLNYAFLIAHYF